MINSVTRSGTNSFHGSAYDFLRNSALDARNFFDGAAPPPFRKNQYGGSLGGPVKKDKLFFFVNYEGIRQLLGGTSKVTVPDSNARNGFLPCNVAGTDLHVRSLDQSCERRGEPQGRSTAGTLPGGDGQYRKRSGECVYGREPDHFTKITSLPAEITRSRVGIPCSSGTFPMLHR